MRLFSKSTADTPASPHARQRPPRAPDGPALGPTQLAWLRRTMPTSFAAAEQAARLAGRAAAPADAPSPAPALPEPLAASRALGEALDAAGVPFLALRGREAPDETDRREAKAFTGAGAPARLALADAARAVLEAHDAGRNRTVPLEALRAALAGCED